MSIEKFKPRTLRIQHGQRREVRTQFGALCYRLQNEKVQVLLITSRGTGRWITPKGWPLHDLDPTRTAEREAYEEAGVEGRVGKRCLGIYSYDKIFDDNDDLPCVVAMFPFRVKRLLRSWPEKSERRRKWVSRKKAAQMVAEPELQQIILGFSPKYDDRPGG
ncbi:MAG: NUDIX hydrolase [Pseudomonadota bacterium]